MIEDVKIGVSKGGMACGPVEGHVVAEVRIRDTETNTVTFYAVTEVGGTLNFASTPESTYDIQIEENYNDKEAWKKVDDGEDGGYSDYDEFYEDLEKHEICNEAFAPIWKYLAYIVSVNWDEVNRMKAESIGKCLGEFEIPVCDAEQEYLDSLDEDTEE